MQIWRVAGIIRSKNVTSPEHVPSKRGHTHIFFKIGPDIRNQSVAGFIPCNLARCWERRRQLPSPLFCISDSVET